MDRQQNIEQQIAAIVGNITGRTPGAQDMEVPWAELGVNHVSRRAALAVRVGQTFNLDLAEMPRKLAEHDSIQSLSAWIRAQLTQAQ